MSTLRRSSWVDYDASSEFPIENLPFGVFSADHRGPRCGTRIGDYAVDLVELAEAGLLTSLPFDARHVFAAPTLNRFMSLSRSDWRAARKALTEIFAADGDDTLQRTAELRSKVMKGVPEVVMHMPVHIGDYTDFYSSREHATNVGTMFRDPKNALQPNWLHLPVGYHGRASSVVISGTPVTRPCGQVQKDAMDPSQGSDFSPCKQLDFELEMAMFVGGRPPSLGSPIDIQEAEEYIFGFAACNDWSARDLQKWEYVPLGPFTAKNFITTISPWIVTADALEAFRCPTSAGVQDDPVPLPYLRDPRYSSFDVKLFVDLETPMQGSAGSCRTTIARSNFKHLYWTPSQQLVHHTVSGCNMRPGDMLASGTISGDHEGSFGSMLELSWKGTKTIELTDGSTRKFLEDGDEVIIRAVCEGDGFRIGFGECAGRVLPAGLHMMSSPDAAESAEQEEALQEVVLHHSPGMTSSRVARIALAHYGVGYAETSSSTTSSPRPSLASVELHFTHAGERNIAKGLLAIVDVLDRCARRQAWPLVPPLSSFSERSRVLEICEATLPALGSSTTATDALLAVEESLLDSKTTTKFAVGDAPSLADALIAAMLLSARKEAGDFSSRLGPRLLQLEDEYASLPAFHQVLRLSE